MNRLGPRGLVAVNTLSNQLAYDAMKKLKEDWVAAKPEMPQTTEGKGGMAGQLSLVEGEYERLFDIMTELFENTAEYIKETSEGFAKVDEDSDRILKAN